MLIDPKIKPTFFNTRKDRLHWNYSDTNNTISEFNCSIENLEDTSQTLLIDSLQLEIMYIGSQLDSMHLKYDE